MIIDWKCALNRLQTSAKCQSAIARYAYIRANGIRYISNVKDVCIFAHLLIHEYCVQHPQWIPHQWSNAVLCFDQWKPKSMYSIRLRTLRQCRNKRKKKTTSTQMIARALMKEKKPKVKNTLAIHLKNLIHSVCN